MGKLMNILSQGTTKEQPEMNSVSGCLVNYDDALSITGYRHI